MCHAMLTVELSRALAFQTAGCENLPIVSVEQELVSRALHGDGRAFATLVEPHLAMLYRIAVRACGNRQLAEDAVQEALTLAFQKLAHYEPGTSLKAFLAAIAARQARTLLRGEKRRRAREDAAQPPECIANPQELLNAARTAQRVREALGSMPKKRQQIALLRLDGNMSYTEIAEAVGTTEGSARVLVHLALKELRERLSDVLGEQAEVADSRRSQT
jgi:RNA polymerase sigma-70 factor (ECF subfamily)